MSPKGACAVCAAKALNQLGGAASPLIQRFRHVRRGELMLITRPLSFEANNIFVKNNNPCLSSQSNWHRSLCIFIFISSTSYTFTFKIVSWLLEGRWQSYKVRNLGIESPAFLMFLTKYLMAKQKCRGLPP